MYVCIYISQRPKYILYIYSQGAILFAKEDTFGFLAASQDAFKQLCMVSGVLLASGFPERRTHHCQEVSASFPVLWSGRPVPGVAHQAIEMQWP